MLHELVPTLNPAAVKGSKQPAAASKPSSAMPSIAMPQQHVPDSFGSGILTRKGPREAQEEDDKRVGPSASETKKIKSLSNKLENKLKQGKGKLDDLEALEESVKKSTLLYLAYIFNQSNLHVVFQLPSICG